MKTVTAQIPGFVRSVVLIVAATNTVESGAGAVELSADEGRAIAERMMAVRQEVWSLVGNADVEKLGPMVSSKDAKKLSYELAVDFSTDRWKVFQVVPGLFWFKYIRNENESLMMMGDGVTISKDIPSKMHNYPYLRAFDIRGAGLQTVGELDYRWSFEKSRDLYLKNGRLIKAERDESDALSLTWEFPLEKPKGLTRRTIVVDLKNGLTPIELTVGMYIGESVSGNVPSLAPYEHSKIKWEQVNNAWVPKNWEFQSSKGDIVRKCEFKWTAVNNEIPDSVFSLAEMKPAPGTYLINTRPSKPIIEDVIGDPDKRTLIASQSKVPAELPETAWNAFQVILLCLNIIVVIVAVCALLWKRSRMRAA